ncbi:MAG: hypothetical protein JW934_10380 [Anaerolineae bacterium]|nr:hypothetical protein [Anaerolineae bacterium]
MLGQVHDHIVSELNASSRTDTIFVITAVVFNLIVLGINSVVAGEASSSYQESASIASDVVLGVFIAMSLLVNGIVVTALQLGRGTRNKLLAGLLKMYRDNGVDQYYDASLLTGYGKRYLLFTGVILCLAVTGIVVPLVIRLL